MLKKNDLVTVEITDLTTEGEGIGKAGAFPLFIKDTMPGDRVRAVVTKLKKNYGYGKALEILTPSPDRTPMRCPLARRCGGCQIQEMDYQAQLQFKTRKVQNNLQRIGTYPSRSFPASVWKSPGITAIKHRCLSGGTRPGRLCAASTRAVHMISSNRKTAF